MRIVLWIKYSFRFVNYNKIITEKKLENYYDLIMNGSKMRFIYMKTDDAMSENVMGFVDVFPNEEFNLLSKNGSHDQRITSQRNETPDHLLFGRR